MSINIFQFLKQGTTLSRNSLQKNKKLQEKITPQVKGPNKHFFQTGRFNESQNQDQINGDKNNSWEELDEEKMKHEHNKLIQKSIDLRRKYHIKVQGTDIPFVVPNFSKLSKKYNISQKLLNGIAEMGLVKPTPVQMQAIPALLQDRNVLITAPTGTGKTISYLFSVLQNIINKRKEKKQKGNSQSQKKLKKKKKEEKVQVYDEIDAVIITPQQQLSTQIVHELEKFACNGQNQKNSVETVSFKCISELSEEQLQLVKKNKSFGINVLVATPQSFLNLFGKDSKKLLILSNLKYVILDECDKYFEQSFLQQIRSILQIFSTVKPRPVYGLFSATIQHPVEQLLKTQLLDDALRIQVGGINKVLTSIEQSIEYCTNQYGKILELKNMIGQNRFIPPALIFVQQKIRAKQLYYEVKKIMKNGPGGLDLSKKVEVLSGQKSKQQRKEIIEKFEKGTYLVLITTDLIARGIDFTHVNLVINYDFPNSMLTYIHRIGRTGRAERTGKAVTFFTQQDKPVVKSLANLLVSSGCKIPSWIMEMPNVDRNLKKKLEKYPTRRLPVGVAEGIDKNFSKEIQKKDKIWLKKKEREAEKEKKEKAQNGGQQDEDQWIQV